MYVGSTYKCYVSWLTPQVVSGHLQVDNCIIEDGQVTVSSPGTIHCRYTTFVRTQLTCAHVSLSLIENCHFTECETCAIVVEGAPKGEPNWAHKYLLHYADTYGLRQRLLQKTESCHDECSIANFDVESEMPVSMVDFTVGQTDRHKESGWSVLTGDQINGGETVATLSKAASEGSSGVYYNATNTLTASPCCARLEKDKDLGNMHRSSKNVLCRMRKVSLALTLSPYCLVCHKLSIQVI